MGWILLRLSFSLANRVYKYEALDQNVMTKTGSKEASRSARTTTESCVAALLKLRTEKSYPLLRARQAQIDSYFRRINSTWRSNMDCKICLEVFSDAEDRFPYILIPCGHTICYVCLQGIASGSDKCPFCRQTIATTLRNLGVRDAVEESNLARSAIHTVRDEESSVTEPQREAGRDPNNVDDSPVEEDSSETPTRLHQQELGDNAWIGTSEAVGIIATQDLSIANLFARSARSDFSNEEVALECVGIIVDLLETETMSMSATATVLLLFDEYLLRISNCESETGGQQIIEQTLAINLHGKLCDQILFPWRNNPVFVCHATTILRRLWNGHPETMQALFDASFCVKFIDTAFIHLSDLNIQLCVADLLHNVIQGSPQSDSFLLQAGLSRWMMRALSAHEYEEAIFQFMTDDFLGCLRPRVSAEMISEIVITPELQLVEYPDSFSYIEFVRLCVCLICSNGSLPRPDARCIRAIFEAACSGHKGCRELALRTVWTILTYPRDTMDAFFSENGVDFLLAISELRLESVNMNIMVRQSVAKAINFYGRSFEIFTNFVGMEKHNRLVELYPSDLVIHCLASQIPPTLNTRLIVTNTVQDVLGDRQADVRPSRPPRNPRANILARNTAVNSAPRRVETDSFFSETAASMPSRPVSSPSVNLQSSGTGNMGDARNLYSSTSRSTPNATSSRAASSSSANHSLPAVQNVPATGTTSSRPNTTSQSNLQNSRSSSRQGVPPIPAGAPANANLTQGPCNSMSGRVAAMKQLFENQS